MKQGPLFIINQTYYISRTFTHAFHKKEKIMIFHSDYIILYEDTKLNTFFR